MNPAATDRKVVQVVIAGRVQGVWFRAWTVEQAERRGLDGWVRNCDGGKVEAVFAGPAGQVDDMVAACWGGPPLATVDAVDVSAWDQGVEPGFETRYGR